MEKIDTKAELFSDVWESWEITWIFYFVLILFSILTHLLEELSGKVSFQFSIFSIILSIGSQEEIVVTELIIWSQAAAMLI